MNRKLIALDLDGTTLNSNSELSFKTKQVLKKAQDAGHIVSIVTGRPNRNSVNYYDELNLISPMINFNGALGHIPHKKWDKEYELTFNKKIAFEILKEKENLGIKVIAAEGKNLALADVPNHTWGDYFPTALTSNEVLNKFNLKQDPTSMMLLVDKEKKELIVNELNSSFGDRISVGVWGGPNPILELSPRGINKTYGIRYLANHFKIEQKDIIAFGDEHNDAEMLTYAGWGVAMKNGTEQIRSLANDVTSLDNDHDGMAYYLEDYLDLA
nr:Cof-type HAD-IIB family hydrolase [uncultured Ligilactobacillus sp.]